MYIKSIYNINWISNYTTRHWEVQACTWKEANLSMKTLHIYIDFKVPWLDRVQLWKVTNLLLHSAVLGWLLQLFICSTGSILSPILCSSSLVLCSLPLWIFPSYKHYRLNSHLYVAESSMPDYVPNPCGLLLLYHAQETWSFSSPLEHCTVHGMDHPQDLLNSSVAP